MIPPRSPYGLIQEDLWPDEWKILVSCMLLNCTTRKAMEKVTPKLFSVYPDAQSMAAADPTQLAAIVASLGFKNRRTKNLIDMSAAYCRKNWKHAKDLPGIGLYAAAAWEMFCVGSLPAEPPADHALVKYYFWRKKHD